VNIGLDHLGFVARDLGSLWATCHALGFSRTEPEELLRHDPVSGESVSLGQSSCHLVFEQGYVELSAVTQPTPTHHLAAYLAHEPRLAICAFAASDVANIRTHVVSAGVASRELQHAARAVQYGARRGDAQFDWFMVEPAESPEGLVCYVRNRTPELLYQPEVQSHPNGAIALTGILVDAGGSAALDECVARYSRLLGVKPRWYARGCEFALTGGAVDIVASVGDAQRASSGFAGLSVQVRSLGDAARLLERNAVPFTQRSACLIVPRAAGAGAYWCLHEAARVSCWTELGSTETP
jgi:hypothetical protein